MIEGLIATVLGQELRTLCAKRAEFHRGRSSEYAAQAVKFQDDPETPQNANTSSPKKALGDKAIEHADAAARMEFLAAHMVDDETYRLGNSDLSALGIIRRGY